MNDVLHIDHNFFPSSLWVLLGEAVALCGQLSATLIPPRAADELQRFTLIKLSPPPSKNSQPYPEQAADRLIKAFHQVVRCAEEQGPRPIKTADVIGYNKLLLEGTAFDVRAVPGKLRRHDIVFHGYRGAPWRECPLLIDSLCDWLNADEYLLCELSLLPASILKAMVAHFWMVQIHPFGDGNGRTARLLEARILIEGGVPVCAAHLLSNHYNEDRAGYYHSLEVAAMSGDIAPFMLFAMQGLVSGLERHLNIIRRHRSGRRRRFAPTPPKSSAASTPFAHAPSGAA